MLLIHHDDIASAASSLIFEFQSCINLQDDVPAAVKSRRLHEIIALFREAQAAQNRVELGRLHLVRPAFTALL